MSKWLKILGGLVVAGLLAAVFTGTVLAQGPVQDGGGVRDLDGSGLRVGRGSAYGFVDENGDGINDRYASDPAFVDEDGDGVCDLDRYAQGTATAGRMGRAFRTNNNLQSNTGTPRGANSRWAAGQ